MVAVDSEIGNPAGGGWCAASGFGQITPAKGVWHEKGSVGDAVLEAWSVEEGAAAFDRDEVVLIDMRAVQAHAFEHIAGALLFPMPFFEARRLPGQSDKRIVLHCGSGVRSEKVARKCIEAGIRQIAHMAGGFGAWKAAKRPYVGINMATGAPQLVNG